MSSMMHHKTLAAISVLLIIPFALTKIGYASVDEHLLLHSPQVEPSNLRPLNTGFSNSTYLHLFVGLFLFRYTRMVVNSIAYWIYKPASLPQQSSFLKTDVTFIVTTIDPYRPTFVKTISNILLNNSAKVIVALAGKDIDWNPLANCLCYRSLEVVRLGGTPSKRRQMMAALMKVKTPLVAFVDDRVYVPPNFLQFMLPPLEDPKAGVVTPAVLTQRFDHGFFSWAGFWNFLGCIYITRRNFDRQAINTMDGGISTVPGRAFLIRAEIMQDPDYIDAFLNEYMEFPMIGKIGPVNAGEDTFTTRWLYRKGWHIKVQHCPEATVETDNLGIWPRFKDQLSRWSRSSIRSRITQTGEGWSYIGSYPWTFYAVNIQCLTNFPLFIDATLLFTLYKGLALRDSDDIVSTKMAVTLFLCWLTFSKLVKLIPHFRRYPKDLIYFPFYILFVYYYTFHRLHAIITMGNDSWTGRANLNEFEAEKNTLHANVHYRNGRFYHNQNCDVVRGNAHEKAGMEFYPTAQESGSISKAST